MSSLLSPWPYPFWIAHRGGGTLAPENTLAAFRVGAENAFRAFECDVRISADGVPFLLHDDSLDRTSSGCGSAGDFSLTELSQLDAGAWYSATFAGEPIPSLETIASYVINNGFALNIEIKTTPGRELDAGREVSRHAARLWGQQPSAPAPLLSSFAPDALAGARKGVAKLPRALLLDTLRQGWLEEAQALGCVAVVADFQLIDAGIITSLHTAGLRALAFTVNDMADAHRLKSLGLDGIITDALERFSPGTSGID